MLPDAGKPIEESPAYWAFTFPRCCEADGRLREAVNNWQSKNNTSEKNTTIIGSYLISSRIKLPEILACLVLPFTTGLRSP
jgi:hypothetical protein